MSVRRISTGRIEKGGFWIFWQAEFFASKQISFVFGRRSYEELLDERNRNGVARIGRKDDRVMWWAKPDEADESDESAERERERIRTVLGDPGDVSRGCVASDLGTPQAPRITD